MSNKVVIGMGFGDEGKGVTTEYLCSQDPKNTLVVRFSGGHQAGHKVIKDDVEHIFSSFGSGTLTGCPTYWSKNCTFEPLSFWNEYKILKGKGITPKIYIDLACPTTTIYDVFANRVSNSRETQHGTTGTGFFRTRKRHFTDGMRLTVGFLFAVSKEVITKRLDDIRNYYNIEEKLDVNIFIDAVENIRALLNKEVFLTKKMPEYSNVVFEGSQGLMLDEHIGYMPHCTPSDVTPKAVLDLGHSIDELFLITRAYQTRHGAGPMTNERYKIPLRNTEKETNVSNKYQGDFRKSILDLDQLLYAKQNGVDKVVPSSTKVNLVVTCLDQVIGSYEVSKDGKIHFFDDRLEFVKFIKSNLNIDGDLYLNDSPNSGSMSRLSESRK